MTSELSNTKYICNEINYLKVSTIDYGGRKIFDSTLYFRNPTGTVGRAREPRSEPDPPTWTTLSSTRMKRIQAFSKK